MTITLNCIENVVNFNKSKHFSFTQPIKHTHILQTNILTLVRYGNAYCIVLLFIHGIRLNCTQGFKYIFQNCNRKLLKIPMLIV